MSNQLMMRIMTQESAENFNHYIERTRVVAGITQDMGGKFAVVQVENQKRIYGKSKTTSFVRINLMFDLIFQLTHQPLNYMIYIGLVCLFITVIRFGYDLCNYFFYGNVVPGYTSLILSIFFFGSLIVILLGILARYIANIYSEVKNRPLFLVSKKFNMGGDGGKP